MVTRDELLERLQGIERYLDRLAVRVDTLETNIRGLKEEIRSFHCTIFGGNGKTGLVSKVQIIWLTVMYAGGILTATLTQILINFLSHG